MQQEQDGLGLCIWNHCEGWRHLEADWREVATEIREAGRLRNKGSQLRPRVILVQLSSRLRSTAGFWASGLA